jgi:hypothetical protein
MNSDHETAPLDARIAAAFEPDTSSDIVVGLISEVQTAASDASGKADEARTRALDPALSLDIVAAARREMEDAAFTRDRMNVASTRLTVRLREVRFEEQDRQRQARYKIAQTTRDYLAQELAEQYPGLAAKLLLLLVQLADNDREIERINERLPAGANRLLSAELVARGLPGFRQRGLDVPSITRGVRLPSFKFEQHTPYVWPQPQHVPKSLAAARSAEHAHA